MSPIGEKFINDLIEALKNENENKEFNKRPTLDIPYLIAPIVQHLDKCNEFVNDISTYGYLINGYEDDTTEGYTDGKIRILIEKPKSERESDLIIHAHQDFCYYIEFRFDERHWGYCQCTSNDRDYNEEKRCCGHGCDFTAPAFSVTKEYNCGYYEWKGDEHDLWDFEDSFYRSESELLADKQAKDKELEIKRLEQIIKESQAKLNRLKETD